MPRMLEFPEDEIYDSESGKPLKVGAGEYPVATEEELLEFANKLRTAGGAEVIPALLPSTPEEPNACLIARALNFGCDVNTYADVSSPGKSFVGENGYRFRWMMEFDSTFTEEQTKKMSEAVGVPYELSSMHESWTLRPLPPHIGNAADAFDAGIAFNEFVSDE